MTYDALDRLTKWLTTKQSDGSVAHDYAYQFDGNSNRTQVIADPLNGQGQIAPDPSQGIPHSNESDLSFTAANEISQIQPYTSQGQAQQAALYSYDQDGNQLGNDGGGTGKPLTITYNPNNQTKTISDTNQDAVAMAWAGAGQSQRTGRSWTDHTTQQSYSSSYTWSLLGLSGYADTSKPVTSWLVRDPSGTPVAQRYSSGQEYYYLFDGQGDVVALEDPGTVVASYDFCPTGNEADLGGGTQPTAIGLANPLRQGAVPYDDDLKLYFSSFGQVTEDYNGTTTRVAQYAAMRLTASCDPNANPNAGCESDMGGPGSPGGGGVGDFVGRVLRGFGIGGGSGVPPYSIGSKIARQMTQRGWTVPDIEDALANPARTAQSTDLCTGDPVTGYYSSGGGYVVRNDVTGTIVQVSNRNDPGWKAPWDPR